jgi:LAO/AO transport system kinase
MLPPIRLGRHTAAALLDLRCKANSLFKPSCPIDVANSRELRMIMTIPTLADVCTGGKSAIARALALVETAEADPALAQLLDAAAASPRGDVLGLTGAPGVGKSTLTNVLIRQARATGQTVGVIAVDPSSQITGGALLGDRTRLRTDPDDTGVFVRSMAARDRLGGLSDHAVASIVLMRAVYDLVIVESVGVGQSEGDIASVADVILLLIQPGAGDSLQFMKAGIMELPDIVAVTKADMGDVARRAAADVAGALTLSDASRNDTSIFTISAATGQGIADLTAALVALRQHLTANGARAMRRRSQSLQWLRDRITRRFGTEGAQTLDFDALLAASGGPFTAIDAATSSLRHRLSLT